MKLLKKTNFYCTLVMACLVWVSVVPQALGFMTFEHEGWEDLNTLIKKVHENQWTIHYSYGDNCPPEDRNNDAALTAAVTEALQMWLQPLREYTDLLIVNDFRYKLSADWDAADFGIIFYCNLGISWAAVSPVGSPGINMCSTTNVAQPGFMPELLHEIGHIFGLADTYAREDRGELGLSKGGLDATKGTQPSSIMMGLSRHREEGMLGRDDKNGIIYLYKHIHENQSLEDCFFTDYALEDAPRGCVPKYPLIFELKHGIEIRALRMLKEDENLDLNARDADGMTALHHAVLNGYTRVVEALLAEDTITVNIFNNARRTPAALARELKHLVLAELIEAHPSAALPPWSVVPKGKLATTWGHLKRRY